MTEGLGLAKAYEAIELCDLIHLETAEALAVYSSDFYAGRPALTVNQLGKGRAYYIASRNKEPFHSDFTGNSLNRLVSAGRAGGASGR